MPRKNVKKKCAAKHNERASKKTGDNAEISLSYPKKHKGANGEDMERHRPGNRNRPSEDQKEPIRRVKLGSLHSSEIRRPAENMRVPEGEVSFRQFAETEFTPREILQKQVT